MTSVIRTKTAKIEMLTAGSPMVPASAASRSTTGRLLTLGRVLVGLEAVAHLVGDGVGAATGVPDVQRGDQEGGHELAQPHQQPDVDVAEDLRRHEVVGVAGEQDVEQVPGQE